MAAANTPPAQPTLLPILGAPPANCLPHPIPTSIVCGVGELPDGSPTILQQISNGFGVNYVFYTPEQALATADKLRELALARIGTIVPAPRRELTKQEIVDIMQTHKLK